MLRSWSVTLAFIKAGDVAQVVPVTDGSISSA